MESRCFLALDLPREAINYIEDLQSIIGKQNLLAGKMTEPENLHLTLKFLGEIDENKIEDVRKKMREIKYPAFEAELGEVGTFSKKFIKIIWVKLKGKVFGLQKEIDEKLKDIFKPEERFMSHITIIRVKNVKDKRILLDYIKGIKTKKIKFKVDKFFLKKSVLKPEGPVYEDMEEYKLEN